MPRKAKQAMTNSYGVILNSYKQQNAAKRKAKKKKQEGYFNSAVKQKTLNKFKKQYQTKFDRLQAKVTKLEKDNEKMKKIIMELVNHTGYKK
tara:strand:- start:825 stop:1100 length:276 start_codon:yes stop_codon:yes gene_type:complete